MTPTPEPAMSTSISVIARLRADILSGALRPGERLLEIPLADRYACSRSALRSAILQLTGEGLVERAANRGASVRRISIDEAIQIAEARRALESLIAARAAEVATDVHHHEFTVIIAKMNSAVAAGRDREYSALNESLHRRLREVSEHDVAGALVENLRNRAAHVQFRLALVPGRSYESLEQHAAIVEAVVAGNAGKAHSAMETHLASVIDALHRWREFVYFD